MSRQSEFEKVLTGAKEIALALHQSGKSFEKAEEAELPHSEVEAIHAAILTWAEQADLDNLEIPQNSVVILPKKLAIPMLYLAAWQVLARSKIHFSKETDRSFHLQEEKWHGWLSEKVFSLVKPLRRHPDYKAKEPRFYFYALRTAKSNVDQSRLLLKTMRDGKSNLIGEVKFLRSAAVRIRNEALEMIVTLTRDRILPDEYMAFWAADWIVREEAAVSQAEL